MAGDKLAFLASLRFYLQRFYRSEPLAFSVGLASLVLAVSAFAVFLMARAQARASLADLHTLQQEQKRKPVPTLPLAKSDVPELPKFSSAVFTERFHANAREVGLVLDEVSYSLESSGDQPYLRYRTTLSVNTGYPQIRRFIAALAVNMPHVSLDAIQCGRENIAANVLSCDLSFSAFFRKNLNG